MTTFARNKKSGLSGRTAESAKAITRRITLNLIIGIVVTIITISGAIFWMSRSQNEQAEVATRTMVLGGLGGLEEYIQQFANDYAWWEAGYDAYIAGDREWVDENYGSGIIDTQISDLIFIISTTTQIDYDWAIEDIPTPIREVFTQDVLDDIDALTIDMPHAHDAARSGYVLDGDGIILMAVNRITPVSLVPNVDPDTLPLLVQGIYLNEERLTEMGQQFLIDDVHLYVGEPTLEILSGNFPLIQDMDGRTIGALVWTPPTPGYAVVRSVALPISIALALFSIIAITTAFRARQIATDLASEKEKIETVVSSIGEGVLVVDAEGKIFLCNQFGGLLLGLTQEEILDRHLSEVFQIPEEKRGEDKPPIAAILDVVKARKTVKLPEVTFPRLDGNTIVLSIVATPVELTGVFIGGVVVFHDVTEQKIIDNAKQQFISIAAHQLRTPLSGIKWAISLLVDESMGVMKNEQKVLLSKSYESVNRLVELVNDLLNIDRIESGRMEFAFEPTNLVDLLHTIIADVTAPAERKDIRIEFKPDAGLPELELDHGSIRIVFQNLLENAVHYTPEKGQVSIRAIGEGHAVRISIKDTGIGIPHSQQKSIFGRFFRATNAVLHQPDGSGLGLYIVKQIVERHKGKIWFESDEGKGTTFHVVLPTDRAHSELV